MSKDVEVLEPKELQEVQQDNTTAIMKVIESAALNPAVDVEKMERLFTLQEKILDRQAETEFYRNFSLMQSEIPTIRKDGSIIVKNLHRSSYARFEDINEIVRPILEKYGFSILFKINTTEGINITGCLMHGGGYKIETTMNLPADDSGSKNKVQAYGSSIQYGKRYVISALLNISTSEDNDAQTPEKPAGQEVITEFEVNQLITELKLTGKDLKFLCEKAGVNDIRTLYSTRYESCLNFVKSLPRK